MRPILFSFVIIAFIACAGCSSNKTGRSRGVVASEHAARSTSHSPALPGQQSDGSVLLPNLWSLRPLGKQVELRDFPINVAVDPSGHFAAVLHSGYSRHQILIVDIQAARVVSHEELNQAFYGLEFSPDGKMLYCSGAGEEVIHVFEFAQGNLSGHRKLRLRDVKERGVPAGLAVAKATHDLYAANVWGHRVTRLSLL